MSEYKYIEESFKKVEAILKKLKETSNSNAVLLIDKAGQLITSIGDIEGLDTISFATLSAADFGATSQLAALIGEKNFSSLYHQGEKNSLYISLVANRVIVAVLFDSKTTLGLVRVRTKHASQELEQILDELFEKLKITPPRDILDKSFFKEAEEELDKLFGP
ncbi:MAG: roadblock/LC7 domain-containing protein [Candidatus Hydrothermales bacterium]